MKTNEERLIKAGFTRATTIPSNNGEAFVRFSYPAIMLTLHPDHTFDYFSLELRYSDYDKYITPLIIDEGKEK